MVKIVFLSLIFSLFSSTSHAIDVKNFEPAWLFFNFSSLAEEDVEMFFQRYVCTGPMMGWITGGVRENESSEEIFFKEYKQCINIIKKNIQLENGNIILPLKYKFPVDDIESVLLMSNTKKNYIIKIFFISKYKMSVLDVYEVYGRENSKVKKNNDLSIDIEYTYDEHNANSASQPYKLSFLIPIKDTRNKVVFKFKSRDNVFIDEVMAAFYMYDRF